MKTLYVVLFSLLAFINLNMVDTVKSDIVPMSITLGEEFESTSEHSVFKYTNNIDREFLFYVELDYSDSTIIEIYNDNNESLIYTGGTYGKNYCVQRFTINVGETAYIKFNKENIKATMMAEETQIKATINGQVMNKMLVKLDRGNTYKLGFIIYDETLDKFVDYAGDIMIYSVSQNVYPVTGNLIVIPEKALIGYCASFRVKSINFNIEVK